MEASSKQSSVRELIQKIYLAVIAGLLWLRRYRIFPSALSYSTLNLNALSNPQQCTQSNSIYLPSISLLHKQCVQVVGRNTVRPALTHTCLGRWPPYCFVASLFCQHPVVLCVAISHNQLHIRLRGVVLNLFLSPDATLLLCCSQHVSLLRCNTAAVSSDDLNPGGSYF